MIISISNQKGGVGKSTSVASLAEEMTVRGYRVLACDMDPQSSLSEFFGVTDAKKNHIGFAMDDDEPEPITDLIRQNVGNGFDLVPSNIKLVKSELIMTSLRNREYRLRDALRKVRDNYDYIFIDSLPGSSLLMENVLAASNVVFVPAQCSLLDLRGLRLFLSTVSAVQSTTNKKLINGGVFLTMFDERLNLHKSALEQIKAATGIPFTGVIIPRAIDTAVAAGHKESIVTYDPSSKPAVAYKKLADHIEQMAAA